MCEHRLIRNVPRIKLIRLLVSLIHYYLGIELIFVVQNAVYVQPNLFLLEPIYGLQRSVCRISMLSNGKPVLSNYHDFLLVLPLFIHSFSNQSYER